MKLSFSYTRGFTLIELMVTMAVFLNVIVIATGALYSAQAVNTRLEQTQTVLDGVNLATEVIVRDIRYGSYFYCDTSLSVPIPVPMLRKSCPYSSGGGNILVFKPTSALSGTTDQTQDRVAYYLSNGVLYKNEYPYGGTVRTYQITASDVSIGTLAFYATGLNSSLGDPSVDYASVSDLNQPLITIIISGVTIPQKKSVLPVTFSLETSASSRTLDK
jgi:prepilin-type N-terminal cleavage/methylation domain-containing protein